MKRFLMDCLVVICFFLIMALGSAHAKDVTLAWDSSTSEGVTGYNAYWLQDSQAFTPRPADNLHKVDCGLVNQYELKNLPDDGELWFVVTAYDGSSESGYSNSVRTLDPPSNLSIVAIILGALAFPFIWIWRKVRGLFVKNKTA